ncbi:MAG: DUF4278 domain-containing protein, partial [Moorea sp. SIO4A1]|uniref:DUF4278 domain-containing protein n=1 Tax=Moorena sp. SIO4A1 TaxID=2607835 RepID=UPI00144FF29C
MKLTYRGVSYEYHPKKITTTEVNCTGKYRGLNCGLGSGQGYFILNVIGIWYNAAQTPFNASTPVSQIAIIEAFAGLEDPR